ncbi:MAG TPA: DUF2520 domain-containing protein [Burkholderiaceae bacterium]|nr:DUF2520 domain-containing protein [Burkholderiaceae bacterium]
MKTLNVIGCGRVGQTLAALLHRERVCEIQDLYARTPGSAQRASQFIGAGHAVARLSQVRRADVWLIGVPDTQISLAAEALELVLDPASTPATPAVAFHCSGFFPADALGALRSHGLRLASAHPSLNFASPQTGVNQFPGTPCGLEGDPDAVAVVRELLTGIGGQCFEVATESKSLYHAAAVFCSNFTVVLQGIAREAWRDSGVPEELLPRLNQALLRHTVDNALALGPAVSLTGPAARGDLEVVRKQGEAVAAWHPIAGDVYRAMSLLAANLARNGRTAPKRSGE